MSLLLENNILTRLTQVNVLVGLILLVVGILFACLAGYITKKIRKTKKVDPSDKIYLVLKCFALLVVMAALISMIIE